MAKSARVSPLLPAWGTSRFPQTRSTGPLRGQDASRLYRFLPSARSLAIAAALVATSVGLYLIARETTMFALRSVEVFHPSTHTFDAAGSMLVPRVLHAMVPLKNATPSPTPTASAAACVPQSDEE